MVLATTAVFVGACMCCKLCERPLCSCAPVEAPFTSTSKFHAAVRHSLRAQRGTRRQPMLPWCVNYSGRCAATSPMGPPARGSSAVVWELCAQLTWIPDRVVVWGHAEACQAPAGLTSPSEAMWPGIRRAALDELAGIPLMANSWWRVFGCMAY